MENSFIDKVAWIYIQNRKVLAARSKGKIPFYIPGGKREEGETDTECLNREIMEELKINLKQNTIQKYGVFEAQAHGKPEGTIVRMSCYTAEYEGAITPAAEVEEIGWLVFADRDTEKCSPVDRLILDDLKSKDLID